MDRVPRALLGLGAVLALMLALWGLGAALAQQNPVQQLLASINGARIADGLPPFALSVSLSAAAQRHSDDMAANNLLDSVGSDNSRPKERILEAGFAAYSSGVVGIEVVHSEAAASMDWWLASPEHQELILSTQYREIGIGMSQSSAGDRVYWVLDLGAQPNRLPVFIDYGASQTADQEVVLTLSNEGGMIYGEGPEVIGLANAVRVSNLSDLSDASWQPWCTRVEWLLPLGEGVKTVYVEFRDQEGRTALSEASILLLEASIPATVTALAPAPVETIAPLQASTAASPADLTDTGPGIAHPVTGEGAESLAAAASSSPRPVPISRWFASPAQDLLPLACALQALAAVLGFLIAVRRQRPSTAGREHRVDQGG